MEAEHEVLEDELSEQIAILCPGHAQHVPRIRLLPSKMVVSPHSLRFVKRILDMEVREDDIWLLGAPRSGTTWAQEMVWLLKNNLNFQKAKEVNLYKRFPMLTVPDVSNRRSPPDIVEFFKKLPSPRFIKDHLHRAHLPSQLWTRKPQIIYIFRNPKDTAISYFYFYKLMFNYSGPMDLILKAFVEGKVVFAPFWENVLTFWGMRHESNVLFLSFEEMKKDLKATVRKVADFLGVLCSPDEETALLGHLHITSMKDNSAVNLQDELCMVEGQERFIRHGEVGGWRTAMSAEMVKMFDEWTEDKLKETDFPRTYL